MQTFGRQATTFLTLPLVAIGTAAVRSALTIDATFRQIQTLAGKTGLSIDQVRAAVERVSNTTGQAANDVAQSFYLAASAGDKLAKQALPIMTAAAKAAELGLGTTADVTKYLVSVMNSYGPSALSAKKATDLLAKGTQLSAIEANQLAVGLGAVIPQAAQVGIGLRDVIAALAGATNAGVPADRAMTGLRYLIQSLVSPTTASAAAFHTLKINQQDFFDSISKPGGLQSALAMVAGKLDLTTVKGQKLWRAITGGARGAIVANTLVGKTADLATSAYDGLGKSAEFVKNKLAEIKADPALQLQKNINRLKNAMIDLGNTLIPILNRDVIPFIERMVKDWEAMSPAMQATIVKVGMLAAALGPVVWAFGTIAKVVSGPMKFAGWIGGLLKLGQVAGGAEAAVGSTGGAGLVGSLAELGSGGLLALIAAPAVEIGQIAVQIATTRKHVQDLLNTLKTSPGAVGAARSTAASAATQHGFRGGAGVETSPESAVAAAALAQWRTQMTALVRQVPIVNAKLRTFTQTQVLSGNLTKDQATKFADLVSNITVYGGHLSQLKQDEIAQMVATGGQAQAVQMLRDKLAAVKGQYTAKVNVQTAGDDAVKQLVTNLNNLSGRTVNIGVILHGTRVGFATGGIANVAHAASGMVARRPTIFGEGTYATPWGTGAEAAIPLNGRGRGILAEAIAMGMREAGGKGGGDTIVVTGNAIYGWDDFQRKVADANRRQVQRRAHR